MVITKQDLAEWNSHPITKAIFKEIEESLDEVRKRSALRDTSDQTAMQAARNEGVIEGAGILKETYLMLEDNL